MPFSKEAIAKVPPEKRAALEAALKDIDLSIEEIEGVHTKLDAEVKARTEWEAEKTRIEANWKEANEDYSKIIDDLDASEKEKKAATEKLAKANEEKIAAQAKLAEALQKQTVVDTSNFLTKEDANKAEIGRIGFTAKFLKIQREHQKLFNEELDPETFLIESLASKKPIEDYWSEKYKVGEKRTAIAKESREKEKKEDEDRGYQRALAEMRNPALRTLDSSDEPFYVPKDKKEQPWEEPDLEIPEAQALVKELSKTIQ